jgi:hypothetical protein
LQLWCQPLAQTGIQSGWRWALVGIHLAIVARDAGRELKRPRHSRMIAA